MLTKNYFDFSVTIVGEIVPKMVLVVRIGFISSQQILMEQVKLFKQN